MKKLFLFSFITVLALLIVSTNKCHAKSLICKGVDLLLRRSNFVKNIFIKQLPHLIRPIEQVQFVPHANSIYLKNPLFTKSEKVCNFLLDIPFRNRDDFGGNSLPENELRWQLQNFNDTDDITLLRMDTLTKVIEHCTKPSYKPITIYVQGVSHKQVIIAVHDPKNGKLLSILNIDSKNEDLAKKFERKMNRIIDQDRSLMHVVMPFETDMNCSLYALDYVKALFNGLDKETIQNFTSLCHNKKNNEAAQLIKRVLQENTPHYYVDLDGNYQPKVHGNITQYYLKKRWDIGSNYLKRLLPEIKTIE